MLDGADVAAAAASPVSTPAGYTSGSHGVYQPATASGGAHDLSAIFLRTRVTAAAGGGAGGPSGGVIVSTAFKGRAGASVLSAAGAVVELLLCLHCRRRGQRRRRAGKSPACVIIVLGMILPTLVSMFAPEHYTRADGTDHVAARNTPCLTHLGHREELPVEVPRDIVRQGGYRAPGAVNDGERGQEITDGVRDGGHALEVW